MAILSTKKLEIFKEFGGSETNTGSIEGQIALFTERINHISEHLQTNKKDHSSRRALLKLVGQRKRALRYLASKDIEKYRSMIGRLGLRK